MIADNIHTRSPQTEVKLEHGMGDDVVSFAISKLVADTMIAYYYVGY